MITGTECFSAAYLSLKERTKKSIIVFMRTVELKKRLHERIEHLTEAQLERLNEIVEQEFTKDIVAEDKPKERGLFGCMPGVVTYMSDDFNEPLDDFKDYMPD